MSTVAPSLNPFGGAVAHFDLDAVKATVEAMPDIEGEWRNPASLLRFDVVEMPHKMLRRFEKRIRTSQELTHAPPEESPWHGLIGRTPCWLWTGGLHPKGYGRIWLGKDPDTDAGIWAYTHRLSFEHFVSIPKPGYIVDHECNVKTCCNPTHLWPVSNIENLRLAEMRRPYKRRNQYSKE